MPTYAKLKEQDGIPAARGFADEVLTAMAMVHGVLLVLVLGFTPQFVGLLARASRRTRSASIWR